jgi:uncharacterized protein (UPF0332 family)
MAAALDNLVQSGILKPEPSSQTEIKRFIAHAERALADASLAGLSSTGQFDLAYNAAHALALAALRANGYRPGDGRGHRAVVFQSLVHTIGAPATLASTLNRYHTRRNRSEYVSYEEASEAEARDLLALARQTHGLLMGWLRRHPPAPA